MASTAAEATPKSPQSQHTILLAQFTESRHSKHYSDHETLEMAIEAVCQLYETKLKQENPAKKKIVYDISDLFTYIDDLPDMAVLVYVLLPSPPPVPSPPCPAWPSPLPSSPPARQIRRGPGGVHAAQQGLAQEAHLRPPEGTGKLSRRGAITRPSSSLSTSQPSLPRPPPGRSSLAARPPSPIYSPRTAAIRLSHHHRAPTSKPSHRPARRYTPPRSLTIRPLLSPPSHRCARLPGPGVRLGLALILSLVFASTLLSQMQHCMSDRHMSTKTTPVAVSPSPPWATQA